MVYAATGMCHLVRTASDMKPNENAEQKDTAGFEYSIVGKSKAVEQLRKDIQRLGAVNRDVVIVGEAGVGKGAVAKNIFYHSRPTRGDHPLMTINLSVLDDRELESILFGFDRGVEGLPYTSKRGLFEQANGGTVVIEEIEEASFRNQMKILNFINERKTRRIGSETPETVDIRLLMTLKADPAELLEKRKLLEDLYAKLLEFEKIEIPPLRERPEDVPLLVQHFSHEICRELGLGDLVIDINAIEVLVRQTWRENIRELKAVVDKCVLFSNEGRFALPPELVDEKTEVVKMINNILAGQEFVLDKSLDVIEKGIIERSLERFNQSKAAQFLGMTEQTFRYKLKRLGIASARARA
jgi:DNA-binding NtrC family response regulator